MPADEAACIARVEQISMLTSVKSATASGSSTGRWLPGTTTAMARAFRAAAAKQDTPRALAEVSCPEPNRCWAAAAVAAMCATVASARALCSAGSAAPPTCTQHRASCCKMLALTQALLDFQGSCNVCDSRAHCSAGSAAPPTCACLKILTQTQLPGSAMANAGM